MTNKTNFLDKFIKITKMNEEVAKDKLSLKHKSVLVINTLKNNWEEVLNTCHKISKLVKINEIENAFIIENNKELLTTRDEFRIGGYYILNLSSIFPPLILASKEKDSVLDMCCAPGGKAFLIAREAGNKIHLTVNEENKRRFNNLESTLKNLNVKTINMFNKPAQGLIYYTDLKFNKILIDAPCSAEGLININDSKTLMYWSQKKVKQLRNLQKKIINTAYQMLDADGEIVYATCTYSPEENEEVINYIINKYSNLHVEEIQLGCEYSNFLKALTNWNGDSYNMEVRNCIRILPTETFEGFFIAKLKKTN